MRDRPVALDAQADVVAIGVRQHHIEQDEIGNELADECEALAAVATDRDLHPVRLEAALQHVGGRGVVFDDHHARRFRRSSRRHRHGKILHYARPLCSSPRRWRRATTNFDGRSLTIWSRMYEYSSSAQRGSSWNHFTSMTTPGSRAITGPMRHGSELSALTTQGTARYIRL